MAPATPTGLMVSETTETSITWTWNASEGATGYVVQANMDEMWDATDTVTFEGLPFTTETTYTAMDLAPETAVFVRVAAAAGSLEMPLVSAFTTHVSAMSAMPPPEPEPEPEALDPVMVTFSLSDDADDGHFLIADPDDDDEETAMASVNTEIMVESNTTAVITPMFVDGASGVGVDASADNVPFTYVDWGLLQSMVLDGGATFMVQRTTVGANQEMEPSGDVAYVTCGPFTCADGMDAPGLTLEGSAVCTAWEEKFTIELQVGKVENDVIGDPVGEDTTGGEGGAEVTDDTGNDGIDLGWVTSANAKTTIKHVFDGVANGTNGSVSTEAAKGGDKALTMKNFTGAILADTDATMDGNQDPCRVDDDYDMERGGHFKPDGCFRFIGPGPGKNTSDYLSGYTLDISPADIGVAWGNVDWEDDPFEGLECEGIAVTVSDHVDVCDMFEAEVSYATGDGWSPSVVFSATNTVMRWEASTKPDGGTSNFTTVWFDDNLNGDIKDDKGDRHPAGGNALNDLYNQNQDSSNIQLIWESLLDKDDDLIADAGDLGKVDMLSSKDDRSTVDDERTILVESCPSGTSYAPRDGYAPDNTARDSTMLDNTPCKTTAQKGTLEGVPRTPPSTTGATATNPDGNADNYETTTYTFAEVSTTATNTANNRMVAEDADDFYTCSEDDGGNDEGPDGDSSCDARDWENDVTIKFTDGTFGCEAERMVIVSCTWDADGGMAQGRNALPTEAINFDDDPDDGTSNLANFLKCTAS